MNEQIIDDELTRDDLLTITIEENLICTNNSNNGNVQSEIDNCGGISKDQIITDNKINILKNDDIINLVDGICIGGDNNLNNNYCISDGNDGNDNDNDDGGGGGGNVAIVEEAALAVVAAINGCGDGNSDSGVEIGNANNNNDLNIFKNNSEINLQRALSSSNNSGIGGASGASGSGSGNGGGYTSSSCGGFDEPIGDYVSCNSSMISFCSEIGDNNNIQKNNSINHQFNNNKNNDYCTSEGNSESSSIVGGPTISSSSSFRRNMSSASTRKKVILNDSLLINDKIMNTNNKNSLGKSTIKNRYENTVAKSRSRAASANRAAVAIINPTSKSSISPTPSSASSAAAAAAAPRNSRIDGSPSSSTIQNSNKNISIIHQGRSTPIKKLNKPDSLPTGLKDGLTQSIPNVVCPSAVATITRNQLNRTPSLNRNNRTSSGCTPTKSLDDGRWPLTNKTTSNTLKSQRSIGVRNVNNISNNNNNNNQRFFNDAINSHENLIIKTKIGPISLDNYNDEKTINNIIDKYATLPRRRKEKSAEDLKNGTAVAGAAGRQSIRSNSASRDSMMTTSTYHSKGSPSVNNCTSNLNITKEQQIHPVTRQQSIHHPSTSTTTTRNKKNLPKIKLYRETSSQTLITRKDVDDAFSNGCTRPIDINAIEMATKSSQVDIRDKQMESLELKLKKTNEHNTYLQSELTKRSQVILTIEQQLNRERDEKQAMHFELQKNTQRILGLLELTNVQTPPSSSSSVAASTTTSTVSQIPSNNPIGVNKLNNNNNISGSKNSINNNSGEEQIIIIPQSSILLSSETNCDSLLMLESQIQLSGHVLEEKQSEIDMLHSFCRKLQIEMKRSLSVQQNLLEEKEVIEKESTELQDFLQDEKTALVDALKEIELENEENKEKIDKYTSDLERLREECRHLVRISEQRRHEYLGIQSKYNALESRSKELIVQQGTAVSGASKALAGLGARLDKLVEQLISSYNISEQELEDVIYHNEAYTTNSSSGDGSPDYDMMGCVNDPNNHHHQQQQNKLFKDNEQMDGGDGNGSLSPQRHQSFIVAVINAIKNAAVGNSMKYSMQHQRKDIDYHLGGGGGCDIGNVDLLLNGNNQYINNNNNKNGEIMILNNGNNSSVCANNIKHNNNNNNHQLQNKTSCDDSDSTDMLDSETEPCLMMENVLEDVQMPDTHSHNMVSSTCLLLKSNQTIIGNRDHQQQQQQQHQQSESQLSLPINSDQQSLILNAKSPDMDMDKNEESINNLSQAIVNRQQIELHNSLMIRHNSEHSTSDDISVHESQSMDVPSIGEYCSAQALVNEVIDVDNLVTKLLKVLRIIQMDNDNCIQQLISDKNKLQLNKAEISEKLKDYEMLHLQLKNDLQDATHQLMVRGTDLANCKVELQRHRSEIDRLNVDVCNLSTLCTENKNNNINNNNNNNNCLIKSKEDIFSTLKSWHENGLIDERELISRLLSTCKDEIPILKQNLSEKEENLLNENDCNKNKQNSMKNLLTTNWKTAMVETKRQYEAIDKALEILNNMQSIVQRYPELIDLQRQLEETNFNSITNLPLYSALLTASNNNNNNINEDDDNKNNNNNNNNENNIITNLSDCGDENDAATPLNGNNIGGIKGNKNNGTTITTTKQQDMACQ